MKRHCEIYCRVKQAIYISYVQSQSGACHWCSNIRHPQTWFHETSLTKLCANLPYMLLKPSRVGREFLATFCGLL